MSKKGFSIIELMVVVVLMGLIVSISIPFVRVLNDKVDRATRQVVGAVKEARELAITKADTTLVRFNTTAGRYEVCKWQGGVGGSATSLDIKGDIPSNVTLNSGQYSEIFFLPTGSLSLSLGSSPRDSVMIESGTRRLSIKVIPATGIARIIKY
ncbi:prepilin-type N-terminal cleavage/methylation domain-containing protein [candidate division WOR-3 bacterium]|nr:prepilin-type N-terminal cleavage/methylation domain-containing protein [candidate division WOR-3 bacterium]